MSQYCPCYCYRVTDICYERYKEQYFKETTNGPFTVEAADWFAFHSPFCKLVQKGFARLMLSDLVSRDFLESKTPSLWNGLDTFQYVIKSHIYINRICLISLLPLFQG